MKNKLYILFLILNLCVCAGAYAQTDTIRYVHPDGVYSNDGRSWATATNKLQDAINDMHEYMQRNPSVKRGYIYVAAGTYIPTESTEEYGGSMLNTSFKIYGGIYIYGGFNPDTAYARVNEPTPGDRMMVNGKKVKYNWSDPTGIGTTSGDSIASQWDLKYKTILSGNHSTSAITFTFDSIRGKFNMAFPANSYHVVWFATNGKYEVDNDSLAAHYRPLESPASLDGCVISGGNASTRSTGVREHTAYGGGVYMVGNSYLTNCTVEYCNATLRGGGIYMDGGGIAEFCYVHTCHSGGVGVVQGYGGGVCIDYEGSIGHSHITNCAARCGGGLMISHVPEEYPEAKRMDVEHAGAVSYYSPFATACVINNNTAAAEGGGIYLAEGGTINHCTVTGNACTGPDVTYYGRRHGRTGGIYVRNCGMIFNSVFWGNRCATNNDIQFASVRQKQKPEHEIYVYHTAFMNHDISDWTGVTKEMVFSLDKSNMPVEEAASSNYPCFFTPTVDPVNNWKIDESKGIYGAGVFMHIPDSLIPGPRIWHLTSYSALDQKGVQVTDAVQDVKEWIRHAHTDYGVVSNPFEPASTLGALVRQPDALTYALVPPQGAEGRVSSELIPTLFIDPNRLGVYDENGKFVPQPREGNSWTTPIKDLGEAMSYFRKYLVDDDGGNHHYRMPKLNAEGFARGEDTTYQFVQILVKEGTITTAGPGNYLTRDIRTAATRVESHMRLYGGYPSSLTGTNTAGRNPRDYVSQITSNITRISGTRGYENNTAHVIAMVNVEHAIVDGFTLSDANTHNVGLTGSVQAGAGVLINNSSTPKEKRINMVGNQLRNSVITNCTAPKGAAIYVNGEFPDANDSICYAELMMVNCVIRNNKADYVTSGSEVTESHGVITANGRAYIHIEHCNVVNNVGYPFKADSKKTDGSGGIYCAHDAHGHTSPYHGYIRVDNSLIFCNGDRVLDNRGQLDSVAHVTSVNPDGQDYVFGKYNMFDHDIRLHKDSNVHWPRGFFSDNFEVPNYQEVHFMPDGVSSHFAADITDIPADSASRHNQCIFTRANSTDVTYPSFLNPSRNVGNSPTGDRPLYGGKVSYTPMTTNPCVNAGYEDYYTELNNFDRSDVNPRTFGGAPDVGAVENTDLPAAGTVLYVTPNGAGKRDGSSWSNAIAGNTVYVLNNIAGPALASGDSIDEANNARILDDEGNPILTTNEKYNGGWGRVWFTDKTRNETTTHTTKALVTATITYTGGGPNDRVETPDPFWETTSEVTPVSSGTVSGFEPGYDYDPRYPYGEISGGSRSFWRANPYHDETTWQGHYTYSENNVLGFVNDCRNNGWINNTRTERYVGGLQYAVEKASAFNKTYHKDSVQVWVGAGTYNDYKGFIMRDSVTVLGGFPTSKYAAPGISERQALMSNVIDIPKSKPAADLDAVDYETILQISEINPKSSNMAINTDAVKYWDDDYSVDEIFDTETVDTATITRTETYTWQTAAEDVSSTYIRYANMQINGNLVFQSTYRRKIDREGNTVSKNITMGNEEFCGINWTAGQLVVYQYFGPAKSALEPWPDANGNKSWELAYEDRTNNVNYNVWGFSGNRVVLNSEGTEIGTDPCGMALEGVMNTMSIGQTLKNVPAGDCQLQIDMGAYYRNYVDDENTGITFYIIASDGTTKAAQPVYCKSDKLRRYEFSFTQPATGDLTIRLMSEPGSHAQDPATGSLGNNGDSNKANYRKVCMSNVQLRQMVGTNYVLTEQNDDKVIIGTSDPIETKTGGYTVQAHRNTLRKRVLTMPDVCVPTYGGGGIGDPADWGTAYKNDALPHTDRTSKDERTAATLEKQPDPNYVEYNEANWDGFTIRHGFLYDESMAHGGGAGVNMYEGAHLRNCIVIHNFASSRNMKGGGMFCDGATSTIEGCFVLNNTVTKGTNERQDQVFAGGMFMYEGTCFNSLFANNYSWGSAGGVGFCVGRFYNNTIAYNTATLKESNNISGGAISLATSSNPNLFVANTIIFGNNGIAIRDRNAGVDKVNPFLYCYIQSAVAQPNATTKDNVNNWTKSGDKIYGTGNTFLNGVAPSAANTPFAADFDEQGNYVAGRAASLNDFRLRDDVPCVNKGTEEFADEFYTALRHKGKSDSQIRNSFVYKNVEAAQLPTNDVAFAKRVQDCQIDMGAYEFNAAYAIKPDTTTHPGQAIFYITYESPGGDASASSPFNAACAQKLQLVLDAAGRYKYNLMTKQQYVPATAADSVPQSAKPNKLWTVEVWLAGDSVGSTVSDTYYAQYTPTRSTRHSVENYRDNTLDYSFIVPHGVQVKGGYKPGFFHDENGTVVDDRDPLTYRSVLSGNIISSTGAEGQIYHVVTFTNDLFDVEDEKVIDDGGQLAVLTDEKDRAVIDGLFIEDGYANSPDEEDCIGAGAVVTDFAHVRNCVVQNNEAIGNGGGLYLKPYALVSGTILKKNKADVGGGMYIESPNPIDTKGTPSVDSLAHVYATTICENSAISTAGGMWFQNTDARVNSTVIWQNTANDYANVSGSFTRSSLETDYPFSFCAVESRRLEGQGNLEVAPTETEGVRWDRTDPFNTILYYPIEMSSTLAHSGMTYREWDKTINRFTTLDTTDIAGVSRTKWIGDGSPRGFAWGTDTLVTKDNDCIEIGARALNKNFAVNVEDKYVMRRLYVMHTELINSEAARALQDNTETDDISNMYRQMGSCILNPFHRLGDAFDYIIAARKSNPAKYRNAVFEVFIEQGTYFPYKNAYGEQDEVRNNTFLVPEGIYVIGGIDSKQDDHKYGQEGYFDIFTGDSIRTTGHDVPIPGTSYTINYALLDSIRLRDARHRPMRDNNLNSVIEPWEFERQTILSGDAVSGEDFTHVYHVITMHADSLKVGPQPLKFRYVNPDYDTVPNAPLLIDPIPMNRPDLFHEECDLSILGRTTEFDGIQITGGYANHLNPEDTTLHHYMTKTYYQGGGILVDGKWTQNFDSVNSQVPDVTQAAQYNIPIVVENCQFTNNMAGNGGGIYTNGALYMYGCHFTQNYSKGPVTKLDQRFIPWSAGGCIASNANCNIANTLFANNEAQRGLYPITAQGNEQIPNADARQGFGGALSISQESSLRVVNCHFVKNKAVAYSAIYNFYSNNHYKNKSDSMQFVFNTLFWGNEVFEVDNIGQLEHVEAPSQAEIDAFNTKYKASRKGVFHYDGDVWNRYEKLFHEYDSLYNYWTSPDRQAQKDTFHTQTMAKLKELRAVGDSLEGLYFCSYRKTYGPTGMRPTKDGYLMTKEEQRAYKDARQTTVRTRKDAHNDIVENLDSLFSYTHGNNNVLINPINSAPDGPNFKQPSFQAGIDGYMQNADWVIARMNVTTDQGWGHYKQNVERGVGYYLTKFTGKKHFETQQEAIDTINQYYNKPPYIDPATNRPDTFVIPVHGFPIASFLPKNQQPATQGIYNYYSERFGSFMSRIAPPLPIGDDYYMAYTSTMDEEETTGNMIRMSKNPKLGVEDVYIDMGIYEYQYVQLDLKGQEIDTVWVATKAKGPNQDGLTWEAPTTDPQYAIELLMSSHNDHDKYVCFMSDDTTHFSPTNLIDNRLAYIITSSTLAPLLPDSAEADVDYEIKSLNFLGGYSYDIKDAPRDPFAHPVVFEMPEMGNKSQRNQLFVVEDMTHQLVQANWQGEYTSRDSIVIPITFDGITFINPYSTKDPDNTDIGGSMTEKGGAAIYYRWQRYSELSSGGSPDFKTALGPDSVEIEGRNVAVPKLTIRNCVFMDNGERTDSLSMRSPAVRIDHGGGSSLIVNSLFHSNAGAPVYAQRYDEVEGDNNLARVPNNVIIVNSTFALNDGHITLESDGSQIHNSIIWLDDLANDTAYQLELREPNRAAVDTLYWGRRENDSIRVGLADRVTNNAIWGAFIDGDDTYHNDNLITDNGDVFEGPGFLQPFVAATASDERRERSFRLNPSVRTMNLADTTMYRTRNMYRSPKNDVDLANKTRFYGEGMDRGAYECLAALQRMIYVQPNLGEYAAGDGTSWKSPLGEGQLQNAIDVAAVYTYLNKNADRETKKAYVFVKGSGNNETPLNIRARDGVYIYGSLPYNLNDTAMIHPDSNQFTNGECHRYVNYIRSLTNGVASPEAYPTRINTLRVRGDEYEVGFLLDGFVFRGQNDTTPSLVLDENNSAVRNCMFINNTITGGAPVVDVKRGLLYNSLLYNDSAAAMVRLGANGLALNNTIVASKTNVVPLDTTARAGERAALNNLAFNTTEAEPNCFTPYLVQRNAYTLPDYLIQNGALIYQLHERSKEINSGVNDVDLPAIYQPYRADSIISFCHDRDILGNPRRIGGMVDNGAFETWRIEPKTAVNLTTLTNRLVGDRIHSAPYIEKVNSFKEHYGGNAYPHVGSVVYLMDSSAIVMGHDVGDGQVDFKDDANRPIIFRPAYMLLKSGSSFFGNGNSVQMNYLSAEKRFTNQQYSMTAFPFDYDTAHVIATSYDSAKDSLKQTLSHDFNTYIYSGAARSAKDYVFKADNSSAWLRVDSAHRAATEGYLMDFGSTMADTVLRFTAFAPAAGKYIYTEDDEDFDRIVYLTQYDHRTAGTGESLNFTRQEDMGWNMKGLPWLVSDYRTDTILEGETYLRQMYIPHVFYQMDAGDRLSTGDQMYTARSWDRGTTMSMGNAFFTQTATVKDSEMVFFHMPYYALNKKANRPLVSMVASRRGRTQAADVITVMPDSMASKTIQYTYGRDGMKWTTNDNTAQLYMLDSKYLTRISLLGAAPTEVDIPLGVRIPSAENYTFSLPDKEAFADYSYVWLIDKQYNRTINLLNEDYEIELAKGQNNNRFAIRIGGFPLTDKKGKRQYIVYTYSQTLFIRGLIAGDKIDIYTPSGQHVYSTTATAPEWKLPLSYQSGYIVKVNDSPHKVLNL